MPAIENPKLESFVHSSVSTDFGISISTIAENCKNYGRFSAWLNSDVGRITSLLQTVKDNGVSPAFFASYEVTEGYNSSWGWLNHTSPAGNPTQDAISVCNWIVSQSNDMNSAPAWIDYANYKDFVPQNVKDAGNADFRSMTAGSIGRVVIAGTAAATWEVYYPLGLKAEYNGVQDYGAPLTHMYENIEAWGGNIEGGGGGGGKPALPVPGNLDISSPYGWRVHPVTGERTFHAGTDWGGGGQTHPIYATQTGIVTVNQWSDTGGWMVYIRHTGDSYHSRYLHLNSQSPVSVGTTVTKGQEIGTMGTTGTSTGIHLHFEISPTGEGFGTETGTIDPEVYLQMDFGGGVDPPIDRGGNDIIVLLLTDALNGWKY